MSLAKTLPCESEVEKATSFLRSVLHGYQPLDFAIRFWDGTVYGPEKGKQPRFIMVLKHPGALRKMFLRPNQLTLGEAFIHNDYDIEGDLIDAFALADYLLGLQWSLMDRLRCATYLVALPPRKAAEPGRSAAQLTGSLHSKNRDSQAVTYHYNVSNDFFRLWLDERMIYSCAYFASADEPLDSAQARKLDYICRKLRLKKGERLLDIGCGWGGLIMHAASAYGVEAHGITLSLPQAEFATERIRATGLEGRCRVDVGDYREVTGEGEYDKIASIGMFEHVGQKRLNEYFARTFRLLRPGGGFLNHGIAVDANFTLEDQSFMDRYVFPDGDLLSISSTLHAAESTGFEVRDLESLREHYALTLRHWVKRLEANEQQARAVTDETTCRIWRLYMAGSAHGFECGRLNLYQALMVKPLGGNSGQPLTRADWYM